jgi:hypothetical protein
VGRHRRGEAVYGLCSDRESQPPGCKCPLSGLSVRRRPFMSANRLVPLTRDSRVEALRQRILWVLGPDPAVSKINFVYHRTPIDGTFFRIVYAALQPYTWDMQARRGRYAAIAITINPGLAEDVGAGMILLATRSASDTSALAGQRTRPRKSSMNWCIRVWTSRVRGRWRSKTKQWLTLRRQSTVSVVAEGHNYPGETMRHRICL